MQSCIVISHYFNTKIHRKYCQWAKWFFLQSTGRASHHRSFWELKTSSRQFFFSKIPLNYLLSSTVSKVWTKGSESGISSIKSDQEKKRRLESMEQILRKKWFNWITFSWIWLRAFSHSPASSKAVEIVQWMNSGETMTNYDESVSIGNHFSNDIILSRL